MWVSTTFAGAVRAERHRFNKMDRVLRRRLVARGHGLGRRVLTEVAAFVPPDAILRRHSTAIARQWTHLWQAPRTPRPPARPPAAHVRHSPARAVSPWCNSICIRAALHPVRRRCSSLKYSRHSRSSRLAQAGRVIVAGGSRCGDGLAPRAANRRTTRESLRISPGCRRGSTLLSESEPDACTKM